MSMRILQISHGVYPYHNAGVEIYTNALSREMIRRGHEVMVASQVPLGVEDRSHCSIPVRAVPQIRKNFCGDDLSTRQHKSVWQSVRSTISEFNPDLIHVQHLIHIGFESLAELQQLGIPFTVSLPDYWYLCRGIQRLCGGSLLNCAKNCVGAHPGRPLRFLHEYYRGRRHKRRCINLLNNIAAPLISISHRTAEIYCKSGVASSRLIVQPWGIDTSSFSASAAFVGERPIRFGYIGSVTPAKGVDVLIRALHKVRTDCTVDIIGDGSPGFIETLQEMALGGPVFFRGSCDHSEIAGTLSKLDVVIVPSVWEETYGLVAQEALAAGKIVIASSIGGLRDRIIDGVNGFLFPPGNPDALARKMDYVATHYNELSERMIFELCQQDIATDGERFEKIFDWTIDNWSDLRRHKALPVEFGWEEMAEEISVVLGMDKGIISQKLKREFQSPGSTVSDAWREARPQNDEEIGAFYRNTDSYIFDLLVVHQSFERRRWREAATSLLVKYGVRSLLDYGGGCGDDSLRFSSLGIDCTLYDQGLLTTGFAKFRAAQVGLALQVVNALPDGKKYDAVYCTEMLEHVPDPFGEIENMERMLAPGGILILTHSFDLIGDDYPSHLERHRGLSNRFIPEVEKLGLEYTEQVTVPGNKFFVFRKPEAALLDRPAGSLEGVVKEPDLLALQ